MTDKSFADSIGPMNFQCSDALKISLSIEKEGLAFYKKAAKLAKDPDAKKLFTRLAEEEEEHIQILIGKGHHLRPAISGKHPSSNPDVETLIAKELVGKVFPIAKGKMANVPEVDNDAEALEIGIESEKRSIEFLNQLLMLEKKLDVRAIFSHLMVEEKKHLQALQELKKQMTPRG